jgi:archaellum component FlaC
MAILENLAAGGGNGSDKQNEVLAELENFITELSNNFPDYTYE